MDKITGYIAVVFMSAAVTACSLDEKVYTQIDESYVTDAEMAESVLLGVYRDLNVDGIYRWNLSMMFNLPTDEAKIEGSSLVAERLEGCNAYSASSSHVQKTWAALYKAVYDANYFLEMMERRSPDFPEEDAALCDIYVAEARFLRGLLYFELVRWFGHVPLVTSTAESYLPSDQIEQADPVKVYEFIEKDLQYAVDNLPYASQDDVRPDNKFRVSKGGALGLLAKVYATWAGYPLQDGAKWELAAEIAGLLVTSGQHSLLPDFEQLWRNSGSNIWDPAESLFELSFWSPLSTNESSGRFGNWNGVRAVAGGLSGGNHGHNAWYRICPTFLTGWKDWQNDRRWALSYADYQYTKEGKVNMVQKTIDGVLTNITFRMAFEASDPAYNDSWRTLYSLHLFPRKWDTEIYVPEDKQLIDNNYTNVNWYILRYADVLLLYAEALNEVNRGPTQEAYEAVNMVRRRGYGLDVSTPSAVADLQSGMDYDAFRQAVRDERSYELAFEGHRRQDLVRWGIYCDTVIETYQNLTDWCDTAPDYYLGGLYTKKGKNELLPIPQREKDLCIKFKQNPEW